MMKRKLALFNEEEEKSKIQRIELHIPNQSEFHKRSSLFIQNLESFKNLLPDQVNLSKNLSIIEKQILHSQLYSLWRHKRDGLFEGCFRNIDIDTYIFWVTYFGLENNMIFNENTIIEILDYCEEKNLLKIPTIILTKITNKKHIIRILNLISKNVGTKGLLNFL